MDWNKRQCKMASQVHHLGTNHDNKMAQVNGLDELDRWAMQQGQAERNLRSLAPARKHVACLV